MLVGAVGVWSVRFYFSDDFWPPESRWLFDWERTELVAVAAARRRPAGDPHAPGDAIRGAAALLRARDDRTLTVENWLPPPQGALYAFTAEAEPLRPLYDGALRRRAGRRLRPGLHRRRARRRLVGLREHGWTYCARCGADVAATVVPTLEQMGIAFDDFVCHAPSTHTWAGRWNGDATRLHVSGGDRRVTVETPRQRAEDVDVEVDVVPGDVVRVTTTADPGLPFAAVSLTVSDAVPAWEAVTPLECGM